MKWTKLSSYCITSGPYKIAKCSVSRQDVFLLSISGADLSWHFDADEAKTAAAEHKADQEKAA
ncbi:hypothetical protein [Salinicola sp. CR57]|uniref:hypothetical protein n=1 Tax=Salinicola sp. CR57 TaxID=1949086 RepID=UPI000DA1B897|nr:hypothetical protein [Salinicola sp. CR57]